jgi:alpha-methylacyl-CoA racemase
MTERFANVFKTRTREEWAKVFDGKDACVAPVLDLDEVAHHPHNRERALVVTPDGVSQPAPAPRLSRTPGQAGLSSGPRGADTRSVLKKMGYSEPEIDALLQEGVVE